MARTHGAIEHWNGSDKSIVRVLHRTMEALRDRVQTNTAACQAGSNATCPDLLVRLSGSCRFGNRRSAPHDPTLGRTPLLLGLALLFSAAGVNPMRAAEDPTVPPSALAAPVSVAEKNARQVCAACHLYPEPGILDKKTWKEQILPRMEVFLGVSPPDYGKSDEGELLKQLRIYPDSPIISKADWEKIQDFYVETAPLVAPTNSTRPPIQVGLKQFTVSPSRFRLTPPATTLLVASRTNRQLYLGDDHAKSITVLAADGRPPQTLAIGNVPIALTETDRGLYVTAIGSFQPSEIQRGALLLLEKDGTKYRAPKILLKDLPRPTQTVFSDFNEDGKTDLAMCLFGNHRGRFSWFEKTGDDEYKEHVLFDKAGAIHCEPFDFNDDGHIDLGVLIAQQTEAFYIFKNDGKGNFTSEVVFQRQPAFGHNYFELQDFDHDGRMDLLVVNGDNGEYASPLKKYHGIRIYLNRGGTRFEEAYFYPLNGATKAMARDFDGDGDLDIAAISFFPDYKDNPRESFVYLENKGGFQYAPFTFPQCISGRWVVMDAGDIDGDGDLDILIGSYIRGPTAVPGPLSQMWEKQGPSLIMLQNTLR